MVATKTPNKKRSSFGSAGGKTPGGQSPKSPAVKTPAIGNKTPAKNKASPGIQNKTPKTPKGHFQKSPKKTPFKKQEPSENSVKNKRTSESENESSPPKKLKKFTGTGDLGKPKQEKDAEKKKQEKSNSKTEPKKKKKAQFFALREKVSSGDKTVLEDLEKKIKAFGERKELSKTAKRKLRLLQRLKSNITGEKMPEKEPAAPSQSKKRNERRKNIKAKHETNTEKKPAVSAKLQQKAVKKEEEDDDEESDYEVENEVTLGKVIKTEGEEEEDSDEDESEEDDVGEESGEAEESDDDEEDDEDEDEDDEEEDDDDSDDVEEVKPAKILKGKQTKATPTLEDLKDGDSTKKTRYVVFVGNLSYDATKQEITEHFVKAGEVRDIRIPTDNQTNKPRGFAYVEFNDEISYQKALSMHHTFIKGRRINVLYTQGGKKKGEQRKNEVKVKNFKLQAMRKQGLLAGSVKENQKRAIRRKNAKGLNGSN